MRTFVRRLISWHLPELCLGFLWRVLHIFDTILHNCTTIYLQIFEFEFLAVLSKFWFWVFCHFFVWYFLLFSQKIYYIYQSRLAVCQNEIYLLAMVREATEKARSRSVLRSPSKILANNWPGFLVDCKKLTIDHYKPDCTFPISCYLPPSSCAQDSFLNGGKLKVELEKRENKILMPSTDVQSVTCISRRSTCYLSRFV